MDLAALPSLGNHLKRYGIEARKNLGQHFLLQEDLLERLVAESGLAADTAVLEIGPGPGGLSRSLLKQGFYVLALERDPQFFPILRDIEGIALGYFRFLDIDVRKIKDFGDLLQRTWPKSQFFAVVANIPYGLTGLLLRRLLQDPRLSALHLMVQEEVAARLVAAAGSAAYGALSVLAQSRAARLTAGTKLPPAAFFPPPKVHSRFVHIELKAFEAEAFNRLEAVVRCLFQQRRKKIRHGLRRLWPHKDDRQRRQALAQIGVLEDSRAEDLSLEIFEALGRIV